MQINQKRLGIPRTVEIKSTIAGDGCEKTLKNELNLTSTLISHLADYQSVAFCFKIIFGQIVLEN